MLRVVTRYYVGGSVKCRLCQVTEKPNDELRAVRNRLADDVARLTTALQRMTDDRDRFAELYQEAIDKLAELDAK